MWWNFVARERSEIDQARTDWMAPTSASARSLHPWADPGGPHPLALRQAPAAG